MEIIHMISKWMVKYINVKSYGEIQWNIDNKQDYLEFQDANKTEIWGTKHYLQWANKYKDTMQLAKEVVMTDICTDVIECYCGYSYRQINEFLRSGIDDKYNHCREMADVLAILLSSAPRIPCDIILYRMVNDDFIDKLITHNKKEHPTPVQEKGFMSTSLLKDIISQNEAYAGKKIFECKLIKSY